MAEVEEYRCFVGGLSRNTTNQGFKDAFRSFRNVLDAKVMIKDFCPDDFASYSETEEFLWFFLIYLVD